MGTISDKLMRIINTKEDIRQALISKGYDVPTSIPFKEYAKMILDLPCKVDSFLDIEGIVARYSASGLTNEQMAANPVWVDKTGNGHDLQMKNFAWGGMSGVGGYVDNWNSSADWAINSYWVNSHTDHKLQFITASSVVQARSNNIYNAENVYKNILNVNGLTEAVNKGSVKFLRIIATDPITSKAIKTFSFETDGVIQISFDDVLQDYYVDYFLYGSDTKDIDITIEQLPLYPGALVFDGVDDYGACDNFPILTKEKGYTVVALRQWITYNPNAISAIATNASDQSFNGAFTFENYNKGAEQTISYGATQISLQYSKSPFSWQTTSKYNGFNIANGNKDATNSLVLGRSYPQRNEFANFAIWELVFLDHDATEEELTKIKDYFVKTYPWLFPDQAWTVTGKTNEDEDRATIANITGNGNDLVLSNFAFSGNSGYGEYAYNFSDTSWISISDYGVISDKTSKSFNIKSFVLADYPVLYTAVNKDSSIKKVKIKVTNSIPGFYFGNKPANQIIDLSTDGIYEIPSYNSPNDVTQYGFRCSNVNDSCNITIEQIPEYEGYLVTDGVDDIASSNTFVYEADFTFIGEWKFIQKDNTVAGINSLSHLYIQNRYNRGATVMINSTFENKKNITDYMTFKAITSKGKGYDENWNEVDLLYGDGNKGTSGVNIGGQGGTEFCHMLFKNMALYMNKVFSKDECIKAYNYLQTIKSK